jgi:hypothetical protein
VELYLHSRDFIYSFPIRPETGKENFVVTNDREKTEKEIRSLSLIGRLLTTLMFEFYRRTVASVLLVAICKQHARECIRNNNG